MASTPSKKQAAPRTAKSTAKSDATVREQEPLAENIETSTDIEPADDRVTMQVDLPEQIHVTPTEELAVAIDVVSAADPGSMPASGLTSTTLIVPSLSTAPTPVIAPLDVAVTASPLELAPEFVMSRRARLNGEVSPVPETAAMLTADRLVDEKLRRPTKPEGAWPELLYAISGHLINIGDSPRVRERKALEARIAKKFEGGARFIPVLTRKGGVGKTTVSTLLGMALAQVRDDRVIAIDANPDRGTLAERVNKQTLGTVRDVVNRAASISSFSDFASLVSRDETRLDVLASDTDPLLSEAFNEDDYNVVADLAARYYSIIITDCGTGIVHSVMRATLQRADTFVIVSGGSVDEARLASETLTWLEANGYQDLVRGSVVAINTATQGTNLVKLDEIESHFQSRVREVVRIPYDPQLAAGSAITFRELSPYTRLSARILAATVVDGLPTRRGA
ncbi:MAG TPA: MinD/ParA family protein [Terrimesophilobacter sp.]|nr:MinD/ParA family protein [Terrimesophilobacter sp.]HRP99240.1 MinD/ParA family protein [Terrimesophilobacter sp.]